jgi:hypothetical protein
MFGRTRFDAATIQRASFKSATFADEPHFPVEPGLLNDA